MCQQGEITSLTRLLNSTYTCTESYTVYEEPEGNWTYELGIPDPIEVTKYRKVTRPYLRLENIINQLYIHAAKHGQIEVMQWLRQQGVPIELSKSHLHDFCSHYSKNSLVIHTKLRPAIAREHGLDLPDVYDMLPVMQN